MVNATIAPRTATRALLTLALVAGAAFSWTALPSSRVAPDALAQTRPVSAPASCTCSRGQVCGPQCSDKSLCPDGCSDMVYVCGNASCDPNESITCPTDCGVGPAGGQASCGNGVCEDGEVTGCGSSCNPKLGACTDVCVPVQVCPADCGAGTGSICGDGTCNADESAASCPADCNLSGGFVCGDGVCEGKESLTCPVDCSGPIDPCDNTRVCTCGNGTCETARGEADPASPNYCLRDCSGTTDPACGNGICEVGETLLSCPKDCTTTQDTCGDGVCARTEDATTCPADCSDGLPFLCGGTIVSFTATPASLGSGGGTVQLSWVTSGATWVTLGRKSDPGNFVEVATSGSQSFSLTQDEAFTLHAGTGTNCDPPRMCPAVPHCTPASQVAVVTVAAPGMGGACQRRGDVTCDEQVDISDVAKTANALAGLLTPDAAMLRNADFDGSGSIEIGELSRLANFVAGLITTL